MQQRTDYAQGAIMMQHNKSQRVNALRQQSNSRNTNQRNQQDSCKRSAKPQPIIPNDLSRRNALTLIGILSVTWFFPQRIARADIHSQVLDAKAKLAPVKAQLDKITKEYEQLVAQQNQTKEKIEKTQDSIDKVQQQIQTKQEELTQKKALLARRVSTAYKKGSHGFLQLLFASTTFAELSSNIYYLDKISEHDHDMIAEVNRVKSELTKTKAALELEKSALEKLEKQQAEELKKDAS